MKKNIKYIIFALIIIIIVAIVATVIIVNQNKKENKVEKESQNYESYDGIEIDKNEISYQENTTVDDLKNEIGANGDNSIYETQTEYDGRKILSVKPDMQFCTILTGIVENKKPENDLSHIEEVGNSFSGKKGIWVAQDSRQAFLSILSQTTKNNYSINDEGYLECRVSINANETDKSIESILFSNKMYIISITGTCYILDEVSGEVTEYPFEKMAPDQACEYYESGNQKIFVLTTNQANILSAQELINAIIYN